MFTEAILFFATLTTSSLAYIQSCNSKISSTISSAPSCTHTTTFAEDSCCPDIPSETKYIISDCKGCALTTETIPLNCFAPCTASQTVDPTLTTTITECDAVVTLDTKVDG
ncbi:unnamed protein product [Cercospora beticola]|nr:unnamed protein product [Cercospora beticola]